MNTEYKGMVEELKKSLARAKANRAHDYYADSSETAINAIEKAITLSAKPIGKQSFLNCTAAKCYK